MKKLFFFVIILLTSLNLFAQNLEPVAVPIPSLFGNPDMSIENYLITSTGVNLGKLKQERPYVGWHWLAPMSISNATFCTEGMGEIPWKQNSTPPYYYYIDNNFELSDYLKENIGYMLRQQQNTNKAYSIAIDYDPSMIRDSYNKFYQCEGCGDNKSVFGFISDSVVINSYQYFDGVDGKFKLYRASQGKVVLQNPWPQFQPSDQNIDMTNSSHPKYLPIFGKIEDERKYGYEDKRLTGNLFF